MTAIVELAERLGKAIADAPQTKALHDARKTLQADAETSNLLKEYNTHADKIAQLEQQNKPVEVADKHLMAELQGKLASSDTFKNFTAAQMEYIDLMRKVNTAIQQHMEKAG
jgi:cell fate (sporulation/competence/biofilm development) regulator YlbF (YheA/YmcA/DUF963 family)